MKLRLVKAKLGEAVSNEAEIRNLSFSADC